MTDYEARRDRIKQRNVERQERKSREYPYVRIEVKNELLWPVSVFVYYSNDYCDWNNTVCWTQAGARRWAKRQIKRGYRLKSSYEQSQTVLVEKTYNKDEL